MSFSHPLIFVRHGVTLWNETARFQGITETELSQNGKTQAASNGILVNQLLNDGLIDPLQINFMSSPLKRALQSAEIIKTGLNQNIQQTQIKAELREITLGRWEGLTSQEVKKRFYEERKKRKADPWAFKPVGGESLQDRLPEVYEYLKSIAPHTVLVTHAGILRIALHLLGGLPKQEAATSTIAHEGIFLWNGKALNFTTGESVKTITA